MKLTTKNNLMSLIKSADSTPLPNGCVLYTPEKSQVFFPLVLSRNSEENTVLVTPQDYIGEDFLVQLFRDETFALNSSFQFNEERLFNLLYEDIEYLTSIVALLDRYASWGELINADNLLKLLEALKCSGFSIPTIMLGLESASRDEIMRLVLMAEEMNFMLKNRFSKMLCDCCNNSDEE